MKNEKTSSNVKSPEKSATQQTPTRVHQLVDTVLIPSILYQSTTMTTRSSLVRWIASLSLCGLVVFCHGLTTRPLSIRLEESQRVLQNLLSIGTHLQNPALYTPSWADRAQVVPREDGTDDGDSSGVSLVALTDIANAGEVLSLFPIHAIGWRGSTPDNNDWIMTATATESESSFRYIDLNLYDERFFPYPAIAPELRHALFIASDPKQQPLQPGWMGHLALLPEKETNSSTTTHIPNCVAVPLPGVCPLCALVSTNPIVCRKRPRPRPPLNSQKRWRMQYTNSIAHRLPNCNPIWTWRMHHPIHHQQHYRQQHHNPARTYQHHSNRLSIPSISTTQA